MKIICIIAVLLAMSVTTAAKTSNRQLMLSIYKDLDAMCRGGYGNRPATDEACGARTKVSALLRNQRSLRRQKQGQYAAAQHGLLFWRCLVDEVSIIICILSASILRRRRTTHCTGARTACFSTSFVPRCLNGFARAR